MPSDPEVLHVRWLMTGFLDGGINPVSGVTVAALEDVGNQVNYGEADDFQLPANLELEAMGIRESDPHCDHCGILQDFSRGGKEIGVLH